MKYLVRSPWWLKMIYPGCVWEMPATGNRIYLSFDDGPHETATTFVLDTLKRYNAKASFFCIGKNVVSAPQIYRRILDEGHTVGNHTFDHLNGWHTSNQSYYENVSKATEYISSGLFRPPYGRIRFAQIRHLKNNMDLKPVMWTVVSGDFDPECSPARCLKNVLDNMRPGSIIVFHDSEKAYQKIVYTLPAVLEEIKRRGWVTEKL